MGLTIHYGIQSRTTSDGKARRLVEQMRQLALDLPFEEVSDLITLEGDQCDIESQRDKSDDARSWLVVQSGQSIKCPWNPHVSRSVSPTHIVAFETLPGPGSESANIGLCKYPKEIEWEYRPEDDRKFQERRQFSWRKWRQWLQRNGHDQYLPPEDEQFIETRKVKTRLGGWRWGSFCKTQYASSPECGGVANFLRCHISVVTLLDRIAKLPTVKVEFDDEGKYGPSNYSDDYQEAYKEGREPTYTWHEGQYDPKALGKEVGDWNGMIAAFVGGMSDMAKASGSDVEVTAPIQGFQNFEDLEFKGSQGEDLQPFLQTMAQLAEQEQGKHGSEAV